MLDCAALSMGVYRRCFHGCFQNDSMSTSFLDEVGRPRRPDEVLTSPNAQARANLNW